MPFAQDVERALAAAASLVNAAGPDCEDLPDQAAVDEFVKAYRWTGRREHTDAELRAVYELREGLRRLWVAGEDEAVEIINTLLRRSNALPQLVKYGEMTYRLHAAPPDAPPVARMAVEVMMALVEVVRGGELRRLRMCEHPDCGNVVVDLSKNRSRRFCAAGCGNRAAVTAYRARRKASPPAEARSATAFSPGVVRHRREPAVVEHGGQAHVPVDDAEDAEHDQQ